MNTAASPGQRPPTILTIADRGTTGLGGPLRADEEPAAGERPDFVNFIRNVGEPKAMALGGGSYGFGKGIFYTVSRCHILVADSVCMYKGRLQRRLIAAALGDGYTVDGVKYTGRHWLGVEDDNYARPLLDDEAEAMATRLGLPRFEPGETGTTVAVVDIDLGRGGQQEVEGTKTADRDAEAAATFIASTMLWNLWPRMLRGRPNRLICSVKRDGFTTAIPDPETITELKPYVDAYKLLSQPGGFEVPRRTIPPREVGRFALVKAMAPVRLNSLMAAAAPYAGRAHHCARMRQADLVVNYMPGEPAADKAVQFGAVFRASTDADPYFAQAEPPTHDDWVLNGLQRTAMGVVRLANSFIKDRLRVDLQIPADSKNSANTPLGKLSRRLAGMMTGADGDRAGASDGGGGGGGGSGGRRSSQSPKFIEGPTLVLESGVPMLRALVEMPNWPSSRIVTAFPRVVLDGGVATGDDEVGDPPQVLGWISPGSRVPGAALEVSRDSERRWELRVASAQDSVIRIVLEVSETKEQDA